MWICVRLFSEASLPLNQRENLVWHPQHRTPFPTSSIPAGSQLAWSLCAWVDNVSKQPNPPAPWTIAWEPKEIRADYSGRPSERKPICLGHSGYPRHSRYARRLCSVEFWLGFQPVTGANVAIGARGGALRRVDADQQFRKSNTKGADLGSYLQSISGFWSATNPLLITGLATVLAGRSPRLAACWIGFQILNNGQEPLSSLPASIQAVSFAPFAAGNQALANCLNNSANYTPCLNQNDAIPHVWATDTESQPGSLQCRRSLYTFPQSWA